MKDSPAAISKNWHVVYTRSRAEKKVFEDLTSRDIECFLPLQKKLRHWKSRTKWVDITLIPGYCFVCITRKEYDRVLQTSNVVSYVTFESRAAIVPNEQIDNLKQMLAQTELNVEVSGTTFVRGRRVMIVDGPLMGLKGELLEEHGRNRFILRIDAIGADFLAEVPVRSLIVLPSENLVAAPMYA
jgi:transcription antitermination factor NusG